MQLKLITVFFISDSQLLSEAQLGGANDPAVHYPTYSSFPKQLPRKKKKRLIKLKPKNYSTNNLPI